MWQKQQAGLLIEEIETVLTLLSETAGLYSLVKEALARVSHDLARADSQDKPWPLLPLVVCETISGKYEQALPAAAGLQFLKASAEVFDDTEDADCAQSLSARYGLAPAINTASALLILAQRAFTRLEKRGIEEHTVVRVIDAVNSHYTIACMGQHLDLSLPPKEAASEDNYLKIIAMKSAAAVACACHTGALLAQAKPELTEQFIMLGHNLGMASQIANDIQGVTRMNDISAGKVTLPVIYGLEQATGENRSTLEKAFYKRSGNTATLPEQINELLFRTGAIHYTTVKMELYRQRALDALSGIEQNGINVEKIRPFLE